MTIFPVTSATLHEPFSSATTLDPVSEVGGADASPGLVPASVPAPGTHAAPISGSEATPPMQADIAAGDTPGDEILAGLNKRWTPFSMALSRPVDRPARVESDDLAAARMSGSSLSYPETRSTWSAAKDDDYDAHLDRMADLVGLQQDVAEMDRGGALTLQLSKAVQGMTASIKTLVTGQ